MSFKHMVHYRTKKTTGKSSILYSWIISYLIICTLLFACNLTLLSSYTKATKKHTERNYFDFLNSIVLQFDDRIAHADNLYTLVSSDSVINEIISTDKPLSIEKTHPISLMLSNQSKHTVFSQVYLYLPEHDTVISNSITDNSKNFFDCYYQNTDLKFEQWQSSLSNANYATTLLSFNGQERYLDLMYKINTKSIENSNYAILVFRISDIAFKSIAYTNNKTGYTLILDQNNNIVMSTTSNIPDHFNYNDYNHNEIFLSKNIVSLCITSSYTGWKFLHIDSVDGFYSAAEKIKNIHLVLIIITMLLCSILSIFFTFINYHPLHNIITTYHRIVGLPSAKISYNYSLIQEVLNDYVSSKQNLYNLEKKLYTSSINEELYKLLQNASKSPKIEKLEFPSDFFTVILFQPYNISTLFGRASANDEEYNTSFLIIQNTMEELFNNDGYFKLIKYNDFFAGVYCYKNQNSSYTYKSKISSNISSGLSFIKENFQFSCDVGVSSVRTGLNGIFFAMKEAQVALSSISSSAGHVVFYDDFKEINIQAATNTLQNLEDTINHLFSYVEKGFVSSATATLDKIYNICTETLDAEKIQMVLFQILEGITSIANSRHPDLFTTSTWTIDHVGNPTETWSVLKKMIDNICTHHSKNSPPRANLLPEIVDYIQKNYSDSNLCTDFISNKFGFSSRYISKLFKTEVGESFSEYLTQYRIEKAKALLKTTSAPIIQIYQQCGFISEKTFFRSFAKYENVTPGKYRELNQI